MYCKNLKNLSFELVTVTNCLLYMKFSALTFGGVRLSLNFISQLLWILLRNFRIQMREEYMFWRGSLVLGVTTEHKSCSATLDARTLTEKGEGRFCTRKARMYWNFCST